MYLKTCLCIYTACSIYTTLRHRKSCIKTVKKSAVVSLLSAFMAGLMLADLVKRAKLADARNGLGVISESPSPVHSSKTTEN